MKEFMNAVASNMLKTIRGTIPNRAHVHSSPRQRCNILKFPTWNDCQVATQSFCGTSSIVLSGHSGGICAAFIRLTLDPISGKATAV